MWPPKEEQTDKPAPTLRIGIAAAATKQKKSVLIINDDNDIYFEEAGDYSGDANAVRISSYATDIYNWSYVAYESNLIQKKIIETSYENYGH